MPTSFSNKVEPNKNLIMANIKLPPNKSPLNYALASKINPSTAQTPKIVFPSINTSTQSSTPASSSTVVSSSSIPGSTGLVNKASAQKAPVTPTNNQNFNLEDATRRAFSSINPSQGVSAQQPQNLSIQQQNPSQNPTPQPDQGLYRQLLNRGTASLEEAAKTSGEIANLKQRMNIAQNDVYGNPNYSLDTQVGRAGLIQKNVGAQLEGLSGQQQSQAAQGEAAFKGAQAAAPVQLPYSSQYIDPTTGKPVGDSAVSSSLNDAVASVVSKLTSGQMTYADAQSALSGYGQGGINALQQALPQGFNVAQSNTLSAQQGLVGPAIEQATQTLGKLKSAVANLQIPGQASGFTPFNAVTNAISGFTGYGKGQTAEVKGIVNEARNALQNALASSKGGTPTDYVGQAFAMLPDNPSTSEVDAAINVLNSLGEIRKSIYGNPGQTNSGNSGKVASGTVIQTSAGPVNPNF